MLKDSFNFSFLKNGSILMPSTCAKQLQCPPNHPQPIPSPKWERPLFFFRGCFKPQFSILESQSVSLGKIMHIGFWIRWGFLILVVTLSPRSSFITKLLKINTTKVIEIRAAPKILVFGGAQNWRKKWQKYCNLSTKKKIFFWRGPKLKIKHDRSIEPDKKTPFWWNSTKSCHFGVWHKVED